MGGTSGLTDGAPYYPIVGDFDLSGGADIFWYRPGSDSDHLWLSSCNSPDATRISFSINGNYKPFTGDFDGDGSADIFWYSPGSGSDTLYLGGSSGGSTPFTTVSSVNVSGDYSPVVGDFDGDGDSDILWYQPWATSSAQWTSNGDGTFSSAQVTNPPYEGFPVGYGTAY